MDKKNAKVLEPIIFGRKLFVSLAPAISSRVNRSQEPYISWL